MRKRTITIVLSLLLAVTFSFGLEAGSASAAVRTPAQVTGLKSSGTSTCAVKVTWKKISGVTGYQIYRRPETSGTWTRVANVTKAKNSYMSTGLKANTAYRFTVRGYLAYKVNGKTKYKYGAFSRRVVVTTKKLVYQKVISTGYYTAGVDLPSGTFDIITNSGIGGISTAKTYRDLRGPGYQAAGYQRISVNFPLSYGEIMEVSNVTITLRYSSITRKARGRTYDKTAGITLAEGDYTVGSSALSPGRYCIYYKSGPKGCITTDRESGNGIVSANVDGDDATGTYVKKVSNIILKKGETVDISSPGEGTLTVTFVPEKK